jgi:ribosomal protein L32
MSGAESVVLRCSGCDRELEVCAFCDEADCGHALCFHCVLIELKAEVPEPHAHGG